jgi:hypothetical protein
MKTKSCVFGCAVAFVALFAWVPMVQADFTYDFTALSNGPLVGQDGWVQINGWGSPVVTHGIGAGTPGAGAFKAMSLGPYSSDTTLVATARFYNLSASNDIAGLVDANHTQSNWLPGFGASSTDNSAAKTCIRDVTSGHVEHYGDTLTVGDTYDFRLTLSLATTGGLASLAYRDVTPGHEQTEFTPDGYLVNVPLALTQDGSGKYDFSGIALRVGGVGTGISQFSLSGVPEPSTMALLATGLIGLLAYAWRKRR